MIAFHCPHCEQEIQVRDEAAGRMGKCTQCKQQIQVPSSNGQPVEETPETESPTPCPHCGHRVAIPENAVGRVGKCPQCKGRVQFTAAGMAAVEEEVEEQPAPAEETPATQPIEASEAPTNVQWHIHTHLGERFGPMPESDLSAWVTGGRLTPDCLLWCDGWEDWQRVGDLYPDLKPTIPALPTATPADPDGFLADLGEPEPAFVPPVQETPAPVAFSPAPAKTQAAASSTTSGDSFTPDRRLTLTLRGMRPWMILFAVSVFALAFLIAFGVIYTLAQWRGKMAGSMIASIIFYISQACIYIASGVFAIICHSRIGAFLKNPTQPRLSTALAAQRTFWLIRSLAMAITAVFGIFMLIWLIDFINTYSELMRTLGPLDRV